MSVGELGMLMNTVCRCSFKRSVIHGVSVDPYWARTVSRVHFKGCIKMIRAVSICHYGLENARRSKFPTWNERANVQVLSTCAFPLPSSISVCDVTQR
jgi:hypothetical protein